MPEYTRRLKERKEKLKNKHPFIKYIWSYEKTFLTIFSILVIAFMVCDLTNNQINGT